MDETRINKTKIMEENTEDQIEQDETNESKYNDIIDNDGKATIEMNENLTRAIVKTG